MLLLPSPESYKSAAFSREKYAHALLSRDRHNVGLEIFTVYAVRVHPQKLNSRIKFYTIHVSSNFPDPQKFEVQNIPIIHEIVQPQKFQPQNFQSYGSGLEWP